MKLTAAIILLLIACTAATAGGPAVLIRDFVPQQGICRAGRPITIGVLFENTTESSVTLLPRLIVPDGVRIMRSCDQSINIGAAQTARASWTIEADAPGNYKFTLEASSGGDVVATSELKLTFLPAVEIRKLPYVPEPEPVKTSILVGAHNCPLWEAEKPLMWSQIRKHPERTPALGFYSQENPEVADWETKWAVEHGISFFIYCWYRTSQGGPVTTMYESAIDAFMKSRFREKLKFTIMWENQHVGRAGIADLDDLKNNLLPYWIENFFKHPSYLKIDNKPLLFVYQPLAILKDLGSMEKVREAFDIIRQGGKDAGFDGVHILGECRATDLKHSNYLKQTGIDYTFAYVWPLEGSPPPDRAVEMQMEKIRWTQEAGVMPQVVTVSQAWSGWRDEGSIWKLPPSHFENLLGQARDFVSELPENELGSKMILLDCWNEWGEGHYIAPYREYGFGYVDAVRRVFSDAPEEHTDLIPEDIGMGPYDQAYWTWNAEQERLRNLLVETVTKPGADEPGLVAWWAFDEADDSPVVLDYSGHRLGGTMGKAGRTDGISGRALVCDGGSATIANNELLSFRDAMTVECWVKTDTPDQDGAWIVNRVYAKGDSGFRLGLSEGKPTFGIPETGWDYHLSASDALPIGRWVHLAGTFDGKTIRIYVDGKELGSMDRPGPIKPNTFNLCLGSYSEGHEAHFTGLLDEVKLYDRALTADQILLNAGKGAAK